MKRDESKPGADATHAPAAEPQPYLSPERLIHELEVHQVELEQQNEQLERTRAELESALARYTDLYEHAPVGYLELGEDGTVRRLNHAAARMLGAERAALQQRRLGLFLEPESRGVFSDFLLDLCERRSRGACEVKVRRPGATPLVLELVGGTVDDQAECRVVATDVTERRRAEAEKRTIEIGLAQADRLANMGVLAAGIAHEVNNPLTYLLHHADSLAVDIPRLAAALGRWGAAVRRRLGDAAFADLVGSDAELLEPAFLDELAQQARDVQDGARRISEISRSFRAFSHADLGNPAAVDVARAISAAARLAAGEIKYRAELRQELAPTPPVWASEGKLAQVFLNLLLNAAHAIPAGRARDHRITLRTWTEGADVLAEVADTGVGIPPENLDLIFEPFFTTKARDSGTGLGLALCKTLLGEVGGTLRVESQLGHGARFVVRLPAMPPEAAPASPRPAAAASAAASPPAAPTPAPAGPIRGRVLLIDDEEPIRRLLTRLIAKHHDVVAVASGQEACALLEHDCEFDVVVCDLMMPTMTGMDVHDWIVSRAPALAERLVFCTGGAFTPKATEYLDRLKNPVLSKPLSFERLAQLLADGVAASRGGATPKW